ncbi:MAG: UvrD-helicase domain-containing protein [Helicobacteraceae bacterium]|jgi:DNA helicase-2/ATP-dependent DNA helicase PcrA|nr:UvrD-helicase domain-containing protein [Helicobacteraceae bacterium]
MERFLNELNEAQREAATTVDGPVLILAGAGTGKTKTITTRLAYLLSLGIDPRSTLTLTFTNRAAREMRDRALYMIGAAQTALPSLSTFHKFGLIFLRFYSGELGIKNNFVIIDSDDRKKILKTLCGGKIDAKLASGAISRNKNSLLDPDEAAKIGKSFCDGEDKRLCEHYNKLSDIYRRYQEYLVANSLVDFDDLLLLPYRILKNNLELKNEISGRYQYLMVDEYQDTNELQFQLLRQLTHTHDNLCVVGDDDQSIYGWRGANLQNILGFADTYKNAKVIKLELNYRSTPSILKAANELIAHNLKRHDKKLIGTRGEGGEDVMLRRSSDEKEEVAAIAATVLRLIDRGTSARQIAVLFRINALSRALEEGFMRRRVPFCLIDSVSFYERQEIKDAIAYLRLIINPNDDFSFRRAILRPRRGIGQLSLERLARFADERGVSLWAAIDAAELPEAVSKKCAASLREFASDIEQLYAHAHEPTGALIDMFERQIGLRRYYDEHGESERVQNLDELYGLARDFSTQNGDAAIADFLSETALASDQDSIGSETVNLMTIHAAKGLEFEHVFVVGLEEGFFPLVGDSSDIEEERRLGYVAFTRAKKSLTLCTAESRFFHGRREKMKPSRFLAEAALMQGSLAICECKSFKKGDLVKHKIFGIGRVTDVMKDSRESKLSISFGGVMRTILSSFVEKI